ncbi:MAG: hypothetical protein PHC97_04650 [Patescibacteria group bacterium]|nr:hypothetical protein [Patescibacteria group bacterium]
MNKYSALREEFISTNGIQEGRWSFTKRLLILPFMILAMAEAFFWTILFSLIVPVFFPKNHPWKRDRRLWPSSFIFFMGGTGCRYVKKNSMTWQALEYLYIWDKSTEKLKGFDRFISNVWNQLENVRATRNRLKNIKGQLFNEIERLLELGEEKIVICSLAAGSARGPIEVVALYLRHFPDLMSRFELILVDNDESSFDFAKKLADNLIPGMSSIIVMYKSFISQREEHLRPVMDFLKDHKPNVIEMVGFTDYMNSEKAVKIFSEVYALLDEDGLLITNNVGPNFERLFLEIVVTWKMLNRPERVVLDFFRKAGFKNVLTVWEACGMQTIYVARK